MSSPSSSSSSRKTKRARSASSSSSSSAPKPTSTSASSFNNSGGAGAGGSGQADERNTLRVLLATDNHVGFMERDPNRGQDSIRAFEEVFEIARAEEVDMVLLGGDIFHDNKPSRPSLLEVTRVLSEHVLGDGSVCFNVLNGDDPSLFHGQPCVNFKNQNVNIQLPVFAIHGNHDDPAGRGRTSAVEQLSSTHLLNYFGRADDIDNILNKPVLIKKGSTRVALYGLGGLRDERLHNTFSGSKVKWMRPNQRRDEWFNLFVLHQNRTKHDALRKNYISEHMLPKWLDVVVWGHEHEQLIYLDDSEAGFHVVQPGSTVITSLCQGEVPRKGVGLLEICGENVRVIPIELKTARRLYMSDIKLEDYRDDIGDDEVDDAAGVTRVLQNAVQDLVDQARGELTPEELELLDNENDTEAAKRLLPLIRVRVDYTGFSRINVPRFGQAFLGKVANPADLLTFTRRRAPNGAQADEVSMLALDRGRNGGGGGDVDAAPQINDLVHEALENLKGLSLLSENGFAEAVAKFVDKQDAQAIADFVNKSVGEATEEVTASREMSEAGLVNQFNERAERLRNEDKAARLAAEQALAKVQGSDVEDGGEGDQGSSSEGDGDGGDSDSDSDGDHREDEDAAMNGDGADAEEPGDDDDDDDEMSVKTGKRRKASDGRGSGVKGQVVESRQKKKKKTQSSGRSKRESTSRSKKKASASSLSSRGRVRKAVEVVSDDDKGGGDCDDDEDDEVVVVDDDDDDDAEVDVNYDDDDDDDGDDDDDDDGDWRSQLSKHR